MFLRLLRSCSVETGRHQGEYRFSFYINAILIDEDVFFSFGVFVYFLLVCCFYLIFFIFGMRFGYFVLMLCYHGKKRVDEQWVGKCPVL